MLVPIALSLSLLSSLFQAGAAVPHLVARGDGLTAAQESQFLSLHNTIRAQHGAAALTWDATLANAAGTWTSKCVFQHSGGSLGPYGENLAAGTGGYAVSDAMTGWTSEQSSYDPSNPQPSHYTQVVWKGTTSVGCALYTCAAGTIFPALYGTTNYYACEYYPAGNVIGQFPQNVS
ncbi:hypothetical protein FRB94_005050 [Tulasnella sp. JGI-2019a]|nr:hypothetical protein FRB93_006083 [Tulasnella sp. JGI-2019a]KAG9000974.1 hypothetical protein FRB94_005050 [Tulasnella sp. JGI-2019a]KAG9021276.1 hypothetical protein FRB95_002477 [Tulasnella sp. JGI-2019a]